MLKMGLSVYLRRQNERLQALPVDPIELPNDRHSRQDPPTVAYLQVKLILVHVGRLSPSRLRASPACRLVHRSGAGALRATSPSSPCPPGPSDPILLTPRCRRTLQGWVLILGIHAQVLQPCPEWLSAPGCVPKPPSKFWHLLIWATAFSRFRRPSWPIRDSADTAQYRKRVSVSPNRSPATEPSSFCNDTRTVSHLSSATFGDDGLTFGNARHVQSIQRVTHD